MLFQQEQVITHQERQHKPLLLTFKTLEQKITQRELIGLALSLLEGTHRDKLLVMANKAMLIKPLPIVSVPFAELQFNFLGASKCTFA